MNDPPEHEEWEWFEAVMVARWAGTTVWEMLKQPLVIFEQYRAAMQIVDEVQKGVTARTEKLKRGNSQ